MSRQWLTLILLVFIIAFIDARNLAKRQSYAKAWVNGKEIDMSKGGTYRDKDGSIVSVSNNGNGVSMMSSSSGPGGCSIVGNMVHDCDGTTRPLNSQDRQMLANYNRQIGDFFRNMFPPGFPFFSSQKYGTNRQQYPPFPPICQACSTSVN